MSRLHTAFDIDSFRPLAHVWIDRVCDYLQRAKTDTSLPVLAQQRPHAVLADLAPLGDAGGHDPLELADQLIAASTHVHHPRYIGHQVAAPVPLTALTELLNAVLNNGMAVFEMGQLQTAMELRVIEWMTRTLDLGPDASGLLTSGGSLGNLTALAAARTRAKARGEGDERPFAMFVSEQAHYCLSRAGRLLGLRDDAIVAVPTDTTFRMRADELESSIAGATARGLRPMAVVANACTTATGRFDPLHEIADVCQRHDVWLHVDGAHGASYRLCPSVRSNLDGIERADSVVWDAHKMLMMPALITGVLFRRQADVTAAFQQDASYLYVSARDERAFDLGQRTLECTKRGMSVTAYVTLASLGTAPLVEHLEHGVALARHLAQRVAAEPDFELAAAPQTNIVCFRHRPAGLDDEALDRHQARLRSAVVASGAFFLVQTTLRDRLYLRCTFISPHTTNTDIDALLESLREAARSNEQTK